MAYMLPSTVEELNLSQNLVELSPTLYERTFEKDFLNIPTEEKPYKREYSLPNGTDWNISNFGPYLNFEENHPSKVIHSLEDRRVPDWRDRSDSYSSSSMEERMMHNYGVKTFNTVHMDSGSTCISSEHTYANPPLFNGLDVEETYQNLDAFLQQVPEINMNESIASPLSSNDSNFELSTISTFSYDNTTSPEPDQTSSSCKRSLELSSEDEVFTKMARTDSPVEYSHDSRKKNNVASKNCRKTRKEKQKEMEVRVVELEKEREELNVEVQLLEELINAHKMQLYSILQKR